MFYSLSSTIHSSVGDRNPRRVSEGGAGIGERAEWFRVAVSEPIKYLDLGRTAELCRLDHDIDAAIHLAIGDSGDNLAGETGVGTLDSSYGSDIAIGGSGEHTDMRDAACAHCRIDPARQG